jgi:hypothetical protein
MTAVIILGLTIIGGAIIGLAILQVAHEIIIRRLYCAPLIDSEVMRGPGALLSNTVSRRSAVN